MQDLAKKMGLSTAAISKGLRGHPGVSEETRKLIFETARAMNYRGITENKQETVQRRGTVFVLANHRDISEPHTMSSYFHLEKALKHHAFDVELNWIKVTSNDKEVLRKIKDEKPTALFVFGRFSPKYLEEFLELNPVVISIDHSYEHQPLDAVMVDSYFGASLAVKHLVEQGHRRIGFIGDNQLSIEFRSRYHGFLDALAFWGIPAEDKFIYDLRFRDPYDNIDCNILYDKLDTEHLPTAFFCANDPIAYVLYNILLSRGLRIPEDISVIGFDNLDSSSWQFPPLTTLDYPREEVANAAVELLIRRLERPNAAKHRIQVLPSLIERKSVAPARKTT